jgi:cold shock CspA family protein
MIDIPTLPPADPVGQVVKVQQTDAGGFGFIIARGTDKRRVFFHFDDCAGDLPQMNDLVQYQLARPRKPGQNPKAKNVRILARAEK